MMRAPLNLLLHSLRRRLWLERGLLRLRTAAWAGSLTMLVLSCYSAFFSPVLPMHAAAAAIAAVLVVAASAAFLRPSLPVCARKADKVFETSSLFLTALEVSRGDAGSPAGRVVMEQANGTAPALRGRLGSTWNAPPLSGFALTLVPLFASMLLLSYATVENGNAAAPGPAESSLHAIEYELEDDNDLVELRSTMGEVPAQPESRSSESVAAEVALAEATHDDALTAETATSATAPGHGREAGDSQGRAAAATLQLDPADTATLSAVDILRRGNGVGADGDGEFAPAAPRSGTVRVLPAAAPATLSDWSTLSPAQVAHARRYLEYREADDE